MNVTVLGCGRWGSFLACYHSKKHDVMLWGKKNSRSFTSLETDRKNSYITLPENIMLESELSKAVAFADYIVVAISAQQMRSFSQELNRLDLTGKTFILCMKGIEAESGQRLTQIMRQEISQPIQIAVWVGPGHVQDFMAGIPNCMVVDSDNLQTIERIVADFNSDLIRLYVGTDLIGTEIGAAAKNVIGIAAGMLDGFGYSSMKGALMARGAREIARLIKAMGGNELSAYGLCHLGDYEATLFSPHSHNRKFGECYIKGEPYGELAEGAATVKALIKMAQQHGVELPICNTVNDILYNGQSPEQALNTLFARSTKGEFYL